MGIAPLHADLIILEHKRRSLPNTVHLLGRQTVHLTIEQARQMICGRGIEPANVKIEIDKQTIGGLRTEHSFISDRTFFGLLGVRNVIAIDRTDYEGADLIIDLNKPLAVDHECLVDFLYGGSVIDNIFDPASYIVNVARLLKVGGRLLEQTILSQHHHPYCLITPAWFADFFTVNRFRNCTMYVAEYSATGFAHMYGVENCVDDFMSDTGPARDQIPIGLTVIAEKDDQSTWSVLPSQDQYRTDCEKVTYGSALAGMEKPQFADYKPPTRGQIERLSPRVSKSYRYLGVFGCDSSPDSICDGIKIVEASYGLNCVPPVPCSGLYPVYRGNVTALLGSMANGLNHWEWTVDVATLGDPAPRLAKALEVHFVHSRDEGRPLRSIKLEPEAHGQKIILAAAPRTARHFSKFALKKLFRRN